MAHHLSLHIQTRKIAFGTMIFSFTYVLKDLNLVSLMTIDVTLIAKPLNICSYLILFIDEELTPSYVNTLLKYCNFGRYSIILLLCPPLEMLFLHSDMSLM